MDMNQQEEEMGRQALLSLGREHPAVRLIRSMLEDLAEGANAAVKSPVLHRQPNGDRGVSYACGGAAYVEQMIDQLDLYLDPSTGPDDEEKLDHLRKVRLGGGT